MEGIDYFGLLRYHRNIRDGVIVGIRMLKPSVRSLRFGIGKLRSIVRLSYLGKVVLKGGVWLSLNYHHLCMVLF